MNKIFETIRLECEILSPVHVGTGEEIPLYEYVISDGKLSKLNFDKVITSLNAHQLERFNRLNEKGNYVELRAFLSELYENQAFRQAATKFEIPVTPEIEGLYREKLDDPANQLLIKLQQRNPLTFEPILPGTSLKGAIRTAILSKLGSKYQPGELRGKPQEVEGKILDALREGRFKVEWDVFKFLKVPDVALPADSTFVCAVKNVMKPESGELFPTKIQMIHEVFHSKLTNLAVKFTVPLLLSPQMKPQQGPPIDKNFVAQACREFYKNKLEIVEGRYFANSPYAGAINLLVSSVNYNENEFLLRVGRFSGMESITLDKHRTAKPSASRNLADGKYPMGWIKCKIVN